MSQIKEWECIEFRSNCGCGAKSLCVVAAPPSSWPTMANALSAAICLCQVASTGQTDEDFVEAVAYVEWLIKMATRKFAE